MCLTTLILLLAASSVAAAQTIPGLSIKAATTDADTVFAYIQSSTTFFIEATSEFDSIKVSGFVRMEVVESGPSIRRYIAHVDDPPQGIIPICVYARYRGRDVRDCAVLVAYSPQLRGRSAEHITIGQKYDPSSEWAIPDTQLPNTQYRTIVEQSGVVLFDRPGTRFAEDDVPESLRMLGMTAPLTTTIYWQPEGTTDRSRWVLIASSDR